MSLTSDPSDLAVDLTLGIAEQSCKECRRRKARCDRTIPTCSPCGKYSRHCLYEKHSRTPLTRRHLTEVEARLEKAEALIRKLRWENAHAAPGQDASAATPSLASTGRTEADPSLSELDGHPGSSTEPEPPQDEPSTEEPRPPMTKPVNPGLVAHSSQTRTRGQQFLATQATVSTRSNGGQGLVETPPREDFEWDELDVVQPLVPPSSAGVDIGEVQIKDGMASLAVDEKDGGYLGVASGAALLRILEPSTRTRTFSNSSTHPRIHMPLALQPDPNRHIVDTMIDAYFATYHLSYPIIHEPTFRAQYSEVIPQPHGRSWPVLAYIVAAIGIFGSSTTDTELEFQLFAHARSMLSFDFIEMGNSTLVQALTLIANYQQKRDKPNSGYNCLGLAVRMATGLGYHKEFPGWKISPLKMELRRRIWWALCVFDVGATITFSRPILWPYEGVEVAFPMNVTDRELTANSQSYPPENIGVTPYTAVGVQARFHVSTNEIYSRVISKPLPTAEEMLWLDQEFLEPWLAGLPPYFNETSSVPPKYAFAHSVMKWRWRNFRIIMYRPFVIRRALNVREGLSEDSEANIVAYNRCLEEAQSTINLISDYWSKSEHNNLGAWYALYFLFQAALIPCICLRNGPFEPDAVNWVEQIETTLRTIEALGPSNSSAARCYQVIVDLCGQYLRRFQARDSQASTESRVNETESTSMAGVDAFGQQDQPSLDAPVSQGAAPTQLGPIAESPQTQLGNVFPMMWPNVNALEVADEVMGDDAWLEFLRNGAGVEGSSWEPG